MARSAPLVVVCACTQRHARSSSASSRAASRDRTSDSGMGSAGGSTGGGVVGEPRGAPPSRPASPVDGPASAIPLSAPAEVDATTRARNMNAHTDFTRIDRSLEGCTSTSSRVRKVSREERPTLSRGATPALFARASPMPRAHEGQKRALAQGHFASHATILVTRRATRAVASHSVTARNDRDNGVAIDAQSTTTNAVSRARSRHRNRKRTLSVSSASNG